MIKIEVKSGIFSDYHYRKKKRTVLSNKLGITIYLPNVVSLCNYGVNDMHTK